MNDLLKKAGYAKVAGKRLIFRASITIKGKKIYASQYGLRGFPLWV